MRRHVAARYHLISTLGGYSPLGEKLLEALSIPVPGGGKAARKKARSKKEAVK